MSQFGLNIFISFVWALLHTSFTFKEFAVGYILGAIIIGIFCSAIGKNQQRFYLVKFFRAVKLVFIFLRELVVSSCSVLYQVLQPQLKIKPGIIKMDINLETPGQVTLLANMITLTPGTMTVEISNDNKALYIHTLVIDDAEAICKGIEDSFESNIKKVAES